MNAAQYEKSITLLEEGIIHFIVIAEFGIVAELCEMLLECDNKFASTKKNIAHLQGETVLNPSIPIDP